MLKKLFIVFLLLMSSVLAEELGPYTSITADVELSGSVDLLYMADNSKLDYFEANVYFFPIEQVGQEVNSIDYSSDQEVRIKENSDNINYRWTDDDESLNYRLNAEVVSKNLFRRIDKTIPFPIDDINQENLKYIEEREFSDINRDIRDIANEVVAGEDDYYDAVFKIAEWTRTNIEYDLNTLTEKSVQKSSWVLENRYGVCDEITNLFISLLRSIKIPVKYVSGLAHSDAVGGWSPHAWAEVYFPGVGWIPFDVTFGEYGWVDPGHIKMHEGVDANEPSVEYFWRAVKTGIQSKEFNINATLKEKGEKFNSLVELNLEVLKDNVGEGSFVPVEVSVRNLQPFYVSSLVFVNVAPGLEGDNTQAVLLKPLQERKIYWLVTIPDDLEGGFEYTGEVVVKDSFGAEARGDISFAKNFEVISHDEAEVIRDDLLQEEGSVKAYDLELDCNTDKNAYYNYEELDVTCDVKNKGNVPQTFDLCLLEDCKGVKLDISGDETRSFVYSLNNYNNEGLFVRAISEDSSVADALNFKMYIEPEFLIEDISYLEVDYDQRGEIKIGVNALPMIDGLDISVDEFGEYEFESISGSQRLILNFDGWDLNEGENNVILKFKYYNQDEVYETEREFSLQINEVGGFRKFLVALRKLF